MKTLSRFAVPGSFTPESTPLLVHIDRQAVEFAARRLPAFVESRQPAQCGVQPLLVRLCVGFTEPSCKIILPFLCLVPKLTDESGVHSVGLEYRDPCEPRGWPADIERLPGPASRSRGPGELAARIGRVFAARPPRRKTSRDGASPHVVGRCAFNDRWSCAITVLTSTNRSHCSGVKIEHRRHPILWQRQISAG